MQEQFDRYKDEMSDTSDTLELLTLDKEMAEEKVRRNVTHHFSVHY